MWLYIEEHVIQEICIKQRRAAHMKLGIRLPSSPKMLVEGITYGCDVNTLGDV